MSVNGWQLLNETHRLFELVEDGLRVFLRWIGDDNMRNELKQKLVLARFICKSMIGFPRSDQHPCAAMRIGWVPGASAINVNLTKTLISKSLDDKPKINSNYLIIGASLGLLGLMLSLIHI